jgi:type II secretion system protein N
MNKKKFLKFSGFLLFTLLVYLLFLYTFFPYSALVPFISKGIKSSSGIQLTISSIRPVFPLGITAKGVSLIGKKGEKLYTLNQLTAEIPLWSLITARPKIEYLLKKEKSKLSGSIQNITKPLLDITLHLDSAAIGELFQDLSSMPVVFFEGRVSAEGNISVFREKALKGSRFEDVIEGGKIFVKAEEGALTIPGIPLSNLRDFSYELMESDIVFEKGVLMVDKLDIKGDLEGLIKGKVFFDSPINQSRMDFRLKLKPSEELKKRAGIVMEIIKGRMEGDGFYSLDIKGNFLQLKPVI